MSSIGGRLKNILSLPLIVKRLFTFSMFATRLSLELLSNNVPRTNYQASKNWWRMNISEDVSQRWSAYDSLFICYLVQILSLILGIMREVCLDGCHGNGDWTGIDLNASEPLKNIIRLATGVHMRQQSCHARGHGNRQQRERDVMVVLRRNGLETELSIWRMKKG